MQIDFQKQVLERSHTVPVVVDFWASWCGPCQVLGPIIEELADGAAGRWELVKLNTEEQPDVAQAFDIRGIPAVKMFHGGRVIAEFMGALPAPQIREWLDRFLPDPVQQRLEAIVRQDTEDPASRVDALEEFLKEHPDHAAGRAHLAEALVIENAARARELIHAATIPVELEEMATDIEALADLMAPASAAPERVESHLEEARSALREGDHDAALEHLVDSVMIDKSFGDELARRAAVALFHRLAHDEDLVRKHQRRLGMALHS